MVASALSVSAYAEDDGPSVVSDKADYVAGETVTLSGAGWQAGESVVLAVNDDEGESWRHEATAAADADGAFQHSFSLPEWFVATYSVVATGETSGTATTSFTDSVGGYVEGTATGSFAEFGFQPCTSTGLALTSDDQHAVCATNGNSTPKVSRNMWVSGFGLQSLVPPTASGIAFNVELELNDGGANRTVGVTASWDGGTSWGTIPANTTAINSTTDVTRLAPSNGPTTCSRFSSRTWTYAELSDANFRLLVRHATPSSGTPVVNIDRIRVRPCWAELDVRQATVNGNATTAVAPSASVATVVHVEHTSSSSSATPTGLWACTKYQIEGQSVVTNNFSPNFGSGGLNSRAFTLTAPAAAGTYDVTFRAYGNDACTEPALPMTTIPFTLIDAITVKAVPNFTFDLSTLPAKTYGDADFSVAGYAASTNSTGAITFALAAGSVGCTVTSAGLVSLTGPAVGTDKCRIDASLAEDANYLAAGPLLQTFNIAKPTLTVTPSPQNPSRQYSDGNPAIAPSYSGFLPGDDATDLDTPPTCAIAAGATATAPTGTHAITCSGGVDDIYDFAYGTGTLTITKEDATVTPWSTNPAALQVNSSNVIPTNGLVLKFNVEEKEPDLPLASAAAGNIANTGMSVKLSPLSGGGSLTLPCTSLGVTGTGYAGVHAFECKNTSFTIPLNTYEVEAALACVTSGCYYGGTGWDAFTAYNPTLGFATGGGYVMRPTKNGPDEKMNFGFTMQYTKSLTSLKGNFIAVRHHADGTVSRLKSNSLGGLVINNGPPCGTASFNGKSTYTAWDATANSGLGGYVTSGNNSFSVYAEDCNNPGTGLDYLWLFGPGVMNMQSTTGTVSTEKIALTGGNISVPHRVR